MESPISIYAAGPLDGISKEEGCGWREELAGTVPSGIVIFSPAHAYVGTVNPLTIKEAHRLNYFMIAQCAGLIANLSGPGRGFGTMREIEFARLNQKPVAIAAPESLRESMLTFDVTIVPSVELAIASIIEQVDERRNTPTFLGFPFRLGNDDDV